MKALLVKTCFRLIEASLWMYEINYNYIIAINQYDCNDEHNFYIIYLLLYHHKLLC